MIGSTCDEVDAAMRRRLLRRPRSRGGPRASQAPRGSLGVRGPERRRSRGHPARALHRRRRRPSRPRRARRARSRGRHRRGRRQRCRSLPRRSKRGLYADLKGSHVLQNLRPIEAEELLARYDVGARASDSPSSHARRRAHRRRDAARLSTRLPRRALPRAAPRGRGRRPKRDTRSRSTARSASSSRCSATDSASPSFSARCSPAGRFTSAPTSAGAPRASAMAFELTSKDGLGAGGPPPPRTTNAKASRPSSTPFAPASRSSPRAGPWP